MEALWFGDDGNSFFDYGSAAKNRKIKYPMLPDRLASTLCGDKRVHIPPKQLGEKRILSADIALMASKKHNNDATAIFVNQMLPTKAGRFTNNIVYCDAFEGLRTEDQALIIRKLYDEFSCDYIVLDCVGVGLGVFDCLANDIVDSESGEIYPALSCYNDPSMAERCKNPDAEKVIWSMKANAAVNSECAILLREGFRSGKIRLLSTEYDGEQSLSDIKGYNSLTEIQKTKLKMPYIHTTLLIDELVNLLHDETGGRVKIYEKTGRRKDRYSSLSYNYYVAVQLESRLGRRREANFDTGVFLFKPPMVKRERW